MNLDEIKNFKVPLPPLAVQQEIVNNINIIEEEQAKLTAELQNGFDKIRCITEDHITPFDTKQNFLFCSFKKHLN